MKIYIRKSQSYSSWLKAIFKLSSPEIAKFYPEAYCMKSAISVMPLPFGVKRYKL